MPPNKGQYLGKALPTLSEIMNISTHTLQAITTKVLSTHNLQTIATQVLPTHNLQSIATQVQPLIHILSGIIPHAQI